MNNKSRIMIYIPLELHFQMRELAIRRRHNVGLEYEHAIELYLARIENYLGRTIQKENKDNGRKETTGKTKESSR